LRFYDILYLESDFSTFYIFNSILAHFCFFSEMLAYFATVTSPRWYLVAGSIRQTAHISWIILVTFANITEKVKLKSSLYVTCQESTQGEYTNCSYLSLTLILLKWRIQWIPNSIPIYSYIQQDATLHILCISGNCSTCFGWYFYPSSGGHTTVSTASGICHTVGTGLSVLWVVYATHSTLKPVTTLPR